MEDILVGFQGRWFRIIRDGLRLLSKFRYDTPVRSEFTEPAVYVCRHSDNMGPVVTMVNLPLPVHPWAYYVWCDVEECYKQCVEYTFTVRYGWNRRVAGWIARVISVPYVALIRSAGSIPVYRNSLKVRETFKESVVALKRGESLLIFPDIDYSSKEGETGALYDGFLMLERLYFKETGTHLPFVPVRIDSRAKRLELGRCIAFRDGVSFTADKERVIQALHDALNDLEEKQET